MLSEKVYRKLYDIFTVNIKEIVKIYFNKVVR